MELFMLKESKENYDLLSELNSLADKIDTSKTNKVEFELFYEGNVRAFLLNGVNESQPSVAIKGFTGDPEDIKGSGNRFKKVFSSSKLKGIKGVEFTFRYHDDDRTRISL